MFKNFDFKGLTRNPKIRFYFRYPLDQKDFFEIRINRKLVGRAVAKPLYGRLTPEGRIDRGAGFNGEIAIVFLPARARKPERAKLLFTKIPKSRITTLRNVRNWQAIRAAAEKEIKRFRDLAH